MTIVTAAQSAAIRLVGRRPSTLFSTTEQFEMELVELATETAIAIAKAHDWAALTVLHTLTGDGSDTSFQLPSDYDRMTGQEGELHSSRWLGRRFAKARDLNHWLDLQTQLVTGSPGFWILLGGEMQILPAMTTGEEAKFYYQSNLIVSPSSGSNKTAFTADADTFRLPERLITLGLIWRWKALKGKEYAEDMRNFEIALAEEIGREKGARKLTIGTRRVPHDAQYAYPGVITA